MCCRPIQWQESTPTLDLRRIWSGLALPTLSPWAYLFSWSDGCPISLGVDGSSSLEMPVPFLVVSLPGLRPVLTLLLEETSSMVLRAESRFHFPWSLKNVSLFCIADLGHQKSPYSPRRQWCPISRDRFGSLASLSQALPCWDLARSSLRPWENTRPLVGGGVFISASSFQVSWSPKEPAYSLSHETGATVVLLLLCYFPPAFHLLHKRRSRWEQAKRMDFVGMVLFVAGLVLFLMGLGWGGQKYPWRSAHVIATIVVGACSLVAFVVYGMSWCAD